MEVATVFTHVVRLNCCDMKRGSIHYLSEGYVPPPCDSCGQALDVATAQPVSDGWSFYSVARKRYDFSETPPLPEDRPGRLRQIVAGVLQPCAEDL